MVASLRNGIAELLSLPDGYEVRSATAAPPRSGTPPPSASSTSAASTCSFGEFSSKFAACAQAAPTSTPPTSSRRRRARSPRPRPPPTSTPTASPTTRPPPASPPRCAGPTGPRASCWSTPPRPPAACGSTRPRSTPTTSPPEGPGLRRRAVAGRPVARRRRAHRADRRLRPLVPGVPRPRHRPRQQPQGPDLQHPGAGHDLPGRAADRVDPAQRRPAVRRRAVRPLGRDPLRLGRGQRLRHAVRHRPGHAQPRGRHHRPRRLGRRRHPVRRSCARTTSSTPRATASWAATSSASPCSRPSTPRTSRPSPTASTTWSTAADRPATHGTDREEAGPWRPCRSTQRPAAGVEDSGLDLVGDRSRSAPTRRPALASRRLEVPVGDDEVADLRAALASPLARRRDGRRVVTQGVPARLRPGTVATGGPTATTSALADARQRLPAGARWRAVVDGARRPRPPRALARARRLSASRDLTRRPGRARWSSSSTCSAAHRPPCPRRRPRRRLPRRGARRCPGTGGATPRPSRAGTSTASPGRGSSNGRPGLRPVRRPGRRLGLGRHGQPRPGARPPRRHPRQHADRRARPALDDLTPESSAPSRTSPSTGPAAGDLDAGPPARRRSATAWPTRRPASAPGSSRSVGVDRQRRRPRVGPHPRRSSTTCRATGSPGTATSSARLYWGACA